MELAAREKLENTAAARFAATGNTEELARLVANGVASKRSRIIYPATYAVARHLPNLTRWFMDRFTPRPKALPAETPRA
jgi:hypothetical protein